MNSLGEEEEKENLFVLQIKSDESEEEECNENIRNEEDVRLKNNGTEIKSVTYSPDAILDHIDGTNNYLTWVMVVASLGWVMTALTVMTASFYDTKPANSSFVTLSDEFGLAPDSSLRQMTSSAFMAGNMLGGLLVSPISDRCGRRPVLLGSALLSFILSLSLAFSPDIHSFIVARALQGVLSTAVGQAAWLIGIEHCPTSFRPMSALVYGMSWVVGYCLLVPIAYLVPSWRMLLVVTSLPLFFFFCAAACELLKEMLAYKKFFLFAFLMSLIWISDTFIYFGLSFYSTSIAGNMYINYFLIGLIEIPAYLILPQSLKLMKRKFAVISSHLVASITFIILIFLPADSWYVLAGWIIGKFAISFAFMVAYVLSTEVFSTDVRNSAMGVCEVISRLGGILAPYITALKIFAPWMPLVVLSIVAALGALACVPLPETKDKPLPLTIAESVHRKRKHTEADRDMQY